MNTDSINFISFNLLEGQVDIVLKALELYAFNLHNVYAIDKDSELEDLRNALLFHTYEAILSQYSSNKYTIGYNVPKECRNFNEHKRRSFYNKKYNYYNSQNHFY